MTLSQKQLLAATKLFEGEKLEDISTQIGISPSTIHRWQKNKEFTDFLADLSKTAKKSQTDTLYRLGRKALARIETILDDDDRPDRTHLAACRIVLDLQNRLPVQRMRDEAFGILHELSSYESVPGKLLREKLRLLLQQQFIESGLVEPQGWDLPIPPQDLNTD